MKPYEYYIEHYESIDSFLVDYKLTPLYRVPYSCITFVHKNTNKLGFRKKKKFKFPTDFWVDKSNYSTFEYVHTNEVEREVNQILNYRG